ncbi:condensation domain-containing protein [Alicyclobacillus fodiniaquatilis]|uniref:Condensation domain-containing protein n=1 Tax=Alicyclobacillus fodiniaquatilis TaxID=1661150 RepID=A0ABW4JKG6_9BACL
MNTILQYLMKNTVAGKIDKETAVQLTKMIKELGQNTDDVAIIGMALQFPSASNPDDFWGNLINGEDLIRNFPKVRQEDTKQHLAFLNDQEHHTRYQTGAYLEEIDKFDHQFFGITPKEASLMDPNQRLFLETVWKAIEDAGYGGKKMLGSKTGVCLGFCLGSEDHTYKQMIQEVEPDSVPIALSGNLSPIMASRISYLLDLKGPSLVVDTACSSSLVAVHTACRMLENNEAEMTIVGGVKIHLFPMESENTIGIESSDGRTKTFDDGSDGTGIGEGVAALLLKPLSKALRDQDHIYAVIKGSAVNQDGHSIGITAPNVIAQEEVIVQAWKNAKVDPKTISYIEAHGTGTKLGDPVEVEGIRRAFQRFTDQKQFCAIGSLKTNMGHLDSLAGLAGLIKAVLALKHKKIPASLHFHQPNRQISFEVSPVYVNDRLMEWETKGTLRRCGVSAFGMSGTNCHVILEEAPLSSVKADVPVNEPQLFTLSALSESVLDRMVREFCEYLETPDVDHRNLTDICYTLYTGRGRYQCCIAMVVTNLEELHHKLTLLRLNGLQTMSEERIFYSNRGLEVEGTENEWDQRYKERAGKKVSLPTYSFARTRCWLQYPDGTQLSTVLKDSTERGYSEPEIKIANLWRDLLGLEEFSVHDDFFELGGNSLEANILTGRIRKTFSVNIPISEVFRSSTIAELAEYVETAETANTIAIEKLRKQEHYELSASQKRLFGIQQFLGKNVSYNMPFAMHLDGALDHLRLEQAWNQLIARHETLRTWFEVVNDEPVQKIQEEYCYKIKCQETKKHLLQEVLRDSIRPFDLAQLPLFNLKLFKLDEGRQILFFDMHHIISDGVSVSVLLKELVDLYQGHELAPPEVQYKEYAHWQKQIMSSATYQKQREFWINQFANYIPVLNMPTDYPRPHLKTYEGDKVLFEIDGEMMAQVNTLVKNTGTSLYAVLLSTFHILLARHSDQEEIVIGSPIAGRTEDDFQETVGMFVNMLPMRNRMQLGMTCREFIEEVMTNTMHAFENQDYQIDDLLADVGGTWSPDRNPFFDAVFALQNMDISEVTFDDVHLIPIPFYELEWNIAKFDLSLFAVHAKEGMNFCLEYSTDLFTAKTAQRLHQDFVRIIKDMTENYDMAINQIDLHDDSTLLDSISLDEVTFDFN